VANRKRNNWILSYLHGCSYSKFNSSNVFAGRASAEILQVLFISCVYRFMSFIKLAVSYCIISLRAKEVDVGACKCRRTCKFLQNVVTCLPFLWFYALLDLFAAHIQDMGRQQTFIWRSTVLLLKFSCSVRHLTVHSISLQEAKDLLWNAYSNETVTFREDEGEQFTSVWCAHVFHVYSSFLLLFAAAVGSETLVMREKGIKNNRRCTYEIS
jgi:hypothetical protein